MHFLSNFIKGIFIGSAAILPGISSGVICIVFGLYEKLLDSILNFFSDIKKNLKFLLPIIIGILISIIFLSKILLYCFNVIPCQIKSFFIGLLLGSIYLLINSTIKETKNKKSKYKYFSFYICFLIGLILIYFEKFILNNIEYTSNQFNSLYLFFSGFLMSIGIVIPRS